MTTAQINQKLRESFGTTEGKPRFRVVWSEDMTEVRKGTFEKYSESGNIYLGTETGFKKVKKYRFKKDRFIIEARVPFKYDDVVTEDHGASYEPAYVFEDKHGNFLPLDWEMTALFCKCWLEVMMKDQRSPSEQSLIDKEVEKAEKRVEVIKQAIEHEAPNLAYGSGVVVPSNYNKDL